MVRSKSVLLLSELVRLLSEVLPLTFRMPLMLSLERRSVRAVPKVVAVRVAPKAALVLRSDLI
jgi:hypothetical protein